MGKKNKTTNPRINSKMISFSKIAFAALLAYSVQGRSARDDDAEYNRRFGKSAAKKSVKARGGIAANLFDEDTPYYDGNKSGKVIFHQEAGSEFSSVSARARGAGADRVAIELYDEDPTNLDAKQRIANFGEFRPNARKVVQVFGLYNDDAQLEGDASIDGKYIGVRCTESGTLIGVCQVEVSLENADDDEEDLDD